MNASNLLNPPSMMVAQEPSTPFFTGAPSLCMGDRVGGIPPGVTVFPFSFFVKFLFLDREGKRIKKEEI